MICRYDRFTQEVTLTHATFSDVVAVIRIWLNKDKEICFSRPQEENDE